MKEHILKIGYAALSGALLSFLIFSTGVRAESWDPGRIIDDIVFTNKDAMSVTQIQAFLEAKIPVCDNRGDEYIGGTQRKNFRQSDHPVPYTCLKQYYENPSTYVNNYGKFEKNQNGTYKTNGKGEYIPVVPDNSRSAARLIWDAAQEHRINPQILLVTLQKEISLVTDDWPWSTQYEKAMGYGCFDDSAGCRDQYAGFAKQIDLAAWQFRQYLEKPDNYNYSTGKRYVLYHPNQSCGGSDVQIKSASTAALYNYTPYQPNTAAVNAYPGTGNDCSSYGNRNFWFKFREWFGSTRNPYPDQTIHGDWDGDGKSTIGIKRGNFYLLDNNNDGRADITYFYGSYTSEPLVGDWDGDGIDTVSVKIGSSYYINNSFTPGSEFKFSYGAPGNEPLAGDWDGDGIDTVSVKIGSSYYINNSFTPGSEFKFSYGAPGNEPLAGDWDGDGIDTVSVKIGSSYYINNSFTPGSEFRFSFKD